MNTSRGRSLWLRAVVPAVIATVVSSSAWGQSTVWSGSGNWFDAGQWSNGAPTPSTAARIASGGPSVRTPGATSAQLEIDGGVTVDTDPLTAGTAGTLSTAQIIVGATGTGNMSVLTGGRVYSTGVDIAYIDGTSGSVTVNGSPGTIPLNSGNPFGAVWNNSGLFVVGGAGSGAANGTLSIVNGGIINSVNSIVAAGISNGYAYVDHATWNNTNYLRVGDGAPGILTVTNQSTIADAAGYVGVGYSDPLLNTKSTGIVSMDNSTWSNSVELNVGRLSTGTLTTTNGSTITSPYGYIGYGADSFGTVELLDSTWNNSINLYVGYDGRGKLTIRNGSVVTSDSGFIGTYGSADGTVTVDHGTWNNAKDLFVGVGISSVNAAGLLTIKNGGQVSSRSGEVGSNSSSTGEVRVQGGFNGTPSSWTMSTNGLFIGKFGTGTLTVEDGARVSSPFTFVSTNSGSNGALNLVGTSGSRGVLETGQVISGTTSHGIINFNGGVLRATVDEPEFIRLFTPGNVLLNSGGGTIDSNGHLIGIGVSMQGTGALTKTGTGTLDLTGVQSYSGLTTVDAGKLLVNGSIAGDALVKSGATLGGSGQIFGAVTVAPGGILSPGNSPGTLQMDSLVLDNQSVLDIELGTTSDQLTITGDVTLDGMLNLIGDPEFFAAGSFPSFISYSGTLIDRKLTIGTVPAGFTSSDFALDFTTPGAIGLVSSVPEPASATTLLIVIGCLRRKRR